ncbi:hypothetical protein ACQ86D_00260 [Streptomyces galilaeus]
MNSWRNSGSTPPPRTSPCGPSAAATTATSASTSPQPATVLNDRFTAAVCATAAAGQAPELDRIAFVHGPADLKTLDGPHIDYLGPLVDRYARIHL